MSFPYANEHSQSVFWVDDPAGSATGVQELRAGLILPGFMMGRPMDVSGSEIAIAVVKAAGSGVVQAIASGTTTVVVKPYDGGTSATNATGTNNLFAVTDFSNSVTGSWTVHQSRKAVGTTTTDLDADDWIMLDIAANLTTSAGIGALLMATFFVYGVPGAPA